MTANELKYTYMEEAMSILDNEELMRKALSLLRNLKEKTFSPAKRSEREVLEEAFQSVKDLKAGKITSRPLEDLSYKIEGLPPFAKEVKYLAKRYKSLKEDILRLRDELLENPLSGTDLGGGLRKVRMSIRSKSQGKRGGARVITFTVLVSVDEGTIYLVTMYDKSEIESMSVKEIRKLLDKCDLK